MKIQDLFENWGITGLELNAGFCKMKWEPSPEEEQAAWELYIELITRIATQPLAETHGDEETALQSIAALFPLTRDLLKDKGRKAQTFSKIAVVILNQKIRPFTAKWHKRSIEGKLNTAEGRKKFRRELKNVQKILRSYCGLLAEIAKVEDINKLEM